MEILVVIPARYDSSRFKAKVLAKDSGKFLIQHTYERALCAKGISKVLIATDNEQVMQACESFGAECIMTSPLHTSGSDRIAEAIKGIEAEIIVNLQADEPEIEPEYLDYVASLLAENGDADMATLVAEFENAEDIVNPNIVKAIVDIRGRAIYFSRSVIPYDRRAGGVGQVGQYLRHMGIYAYRRDFLLEYTALERSFLEKSEKLEQLRAIEHGYTIITGKVAHAWQGIDTAQQYAEFVARIKNE